MKNQLRSALPALAAALLLGCDFLAPKPSPSPSPTPAVAGASGFIADHSSTNASVLPDSAVAAVRALDIYFEHASVGANIVGGPNDSIGGTGLGGLDYIAAAQDARLATTHLHVDGSASYPADPTWPDSHDGLYERHRGNPGFDAKRTGFDSRMRAGGFAAKFDVAMFKFCWIDDVDIADPAAAFALVRSTMEALEADYPTTVFVWWTMPITQENPGAQTANAKRDGYNALVRSYCAANKKYLLDLADIESHDLSGNVHTDANGNFFLDSNYAADIGHLNQAGAVRVANAWWILMARISGWRP